MKGHMGDHGYRLYNRCFRARPTDEEYWDDVLQHGKFAMARADLPEQWKWYAAEEDGSFWKTVGSYCVNEQFRWPCPLCVVEDQKKLKMLPGVHIGNSLSCC